MNEVVTVGLTRNTSQFDARVPGPASADAGGARVVEGTRSSRGSGYTHYFHTFNARDRPGPTLAHRALKRRRRWHRRRSSRANSTTTTLLAKEGHTSCRRRRGGALHNIGQEAQDLGRSSRPGPPARRPARPTKELLPSPASMTSPCELARPPPSLQHGDDAPPRRL